MSICVIQSEHIAYLRVCIFILHIYRSLNIHLYMHTSMHVFVFSMHIYSSFVTICMSVYPCPPRSSEYFLKGIVPAHDLTKKAGRSFCIQHFPDEKGTCCNLRSCRSQNALINRTSRANLADSSLVPRGSAACGSVAANTAYGQAESSQVCMYHGPSTHTQ